MSLINVVENEKLTKNLQKFSGEIAKLLSKINTVQTTFPHISEGNFSVLNELISASKSGEEQLIESITKNSVALDILSPILSPRMMGFLNKEFSLNFQLNPSLDEFAESKHFIFNVNEGVNHPYFTVFLPALQKAQAIGFINEKEMIAMAFVSFYEMSRQNKKEETELFLHNTYIQMQNSPEKHSWFFIKLSKLMKFPYVNYHKQEQIIQPTLPNTGFVFGYQLKQDKIESSPVILSLKDLKSINLHEYVRNNPSIKKDMDEVIQRDTSGQLVQSKNYESQFFFIPHKFIVFPDNTAFHNRVYKKGGYELGFRQKLMNQMLNPSDITVTAGSLVRIDKFVGYINNISAPKLYDPKIKKGTITLQIYALYSEEISWNPKVENTDMHITEWDVTPEMLEGIKKASDRDVSVFLHFCGV